jgi:hypothetical protein
MSEETPRAGTEAARLLAAAQDWLASAAPHLAPVDDDGRTCPCPLCRVVATVREADADEVGRWVDAAVAGLGAALRDVVPEPADDLGSEHDDDGDDAPPAPALAPEPAGGEESEQASRPRVRRVPVDRVGADSTDGTDSMTSTDSTGSEEDGDG